MIKNLPYLLFCCLLFSFNIVLAQTPSALQSSNQKQVFICPPCAHHDGYHGEHYKQGGVCPVCKMQLMKQPDSALINLAPIDAGSGSFLMQGAAGKPVITVFYHKPKNFDQQSKVLFVIPGSGRNAWDYRDTWVKTSEQHSVLIISPSYAEEDYDFAAYHMGGVINNIKIPAADSDSRYRLRDEDIKFDLNTNIAEWIFADFDLIFDAVVKSTSSTQVSYDMFGHSAGGQLLHRMVLMHPNSKVNRVIASNAGFYTLPDLEQGPLFGLAGLKISEHGLRQSFAQRLTLLIGELDNQDETGGTMLHTPTADQQGLGRLSRARSFFAVGEKQAKRLDAPFNWQLELVENVGHDSRAISKAAANYLYSDN